MGRKNILFLCTGNSCRSQMAEGLARHLRGDEWAAYSAGTKPQTLNRLAVTVMKEIGIDISSHLSKHVDAVREIPFDYIVTVCDKAREQCPLWLGPGQVLHHSFDDPPAITAAAKTEEEVLVQYRRVRDEMKRFIETFATNEDSL